MRDEAQSDLTLLLSAANEGSSEAWAVFWQRVHGELRRLAQSLLFSDGMAPTLQATELVHEAGLKLGGQQVPEPHWENRQPGNLRGRPGGDHGRGAGSFQRQPAAYC